MRPRRAQLRGRSCAAGTAKALLLELPFSTARHCRTESVSRLARLLHLILWFTPFTV